MIRRRIALASALVLTIVGEAAAQDTAPRFALELESGATWQGYNDVQIPNDAGGTRFSLRELAGPGPWAAGRLYFTWHTGGRHALRLLVAPFSLTENGVSASPVDFAGATYAAGRPIRATYTFNSYRLTYRYAAHEGSRTTAWIGFTAKVRDAVIALRQDGTSSRKDDLGFVPLLHLAGEWRPARGWFLGLDADAIAGGPGRAEDVAIKVGRDLGRGWSVAAGYRMVEGGADVKSVYTFAWLHSSVVSIRRSW